MVFENECSTSERYKLFTFCFPTLTTNETQTLEIPVEIPFPGLVAELTQRILTNFNLPYSIESDLESSLREFVDTETIKYHDQIASEHLERIRTTSSSGIESIYKKWEKLFQEETSEYGTKRRATDSEVFSNVYHKLVHSGVAQTMLQVERSYALAVEDVIKQRNDQIKDLTERQTVEVDAALKALENDDGTPINNIILKHFEDQNLLQGRWNSEVDTLKESQRNEYRNWIMKMMVDQETTNSTSPLYSPNTPVGHNNFTSVPQTICSSTPIMEESFTIHLGSQMKLMHNLRIMTADIMDFCKKKALNSDGFSTHRQQTVLNLYSNDLSGLVLLNENNDLSGYTGLAKEFYELCDSSTEFHFDSVFAQLDTLKNEIKEAILWRNSGQSPGNLTHTEQQNRRSSTKHLQVGDVFRTKHSNLDSVHVIFHMIVDDSIRSNDINSRHPAILGMRNVLKAASSNDITTLTIPVLLMHEMTEEMTVAWCNKRAELVFKCVKGFMIEMASWGGSELKNVQFLVPSGISEEVFSSLASMLPSIFRVSNPLVFKASTPTSPKNSNNISSK